VRYQKGKALLRTFDYFDYVFILLLSL